MWIFPVGNSFRSFGFFLSEIVFMYKIYHMQDPKRRKAPKRKQFYFAAAAFEETLEESICIVTELMESKFVFFVNTLTFKKGALGLKSGQWCMGLEPLNERAQ